ncbi:hypothetical protein AURDEDRAFT_152173 [Auricularia subglabra TFB-10046 SS5]|nr:hypothetical protein AURDEDRAFT_152173 [Auricularia subglabra TFB-10046 SS5]
MSTPPPPDARWPPDDADSDEYDSDDEVNTSSAHVFFGKLRTPEKRFAHFHTPKPNRPLADVVNGAVQPTPSSSRPRPVAQDTSPNLISFDNSPLSPAPRHAPVASTQPAQIDLLDATVVFDEPPAMVAAPSAVDPTRVPLPDSPQDALSVETLLTPSKRLRLSPNQPGAHVEDAHPEAPDLEQAAAEPATPTRTDALPPSSPPAPDPEDDPMPVSPPRTPQRPSPPPVVEATPPAQHAQAAEPVLNISVTLSPTSLHTPKRKHAVAFPNAAAPPGEVRKKPFGAPRLRPPDAPQSKAGASLKPAPRAPMLGSLSPESDGMLARLLVPSTSGGRQELNLNINIDFGSKTSPLPSLGASGASLKGNSAPPSRPGSPKRVPVSVIFRSPSPPRRVLVSSPARVPSPSPPPRHQAENVKGKPTGLMATRTLPFPLQRPTSQLPAPQSSPVKPAPSSFAHSQSSPVKPSGTTPASGIARPKPSQLRQPTVRNMSRIPQPKPYAPPASKVRPLPSASTSAAPAPLPTRAAKGFLGVGATKVVPSPPHAQPAAPPSPVKPIMIRQVIPGMLSGNRDRAPPVPRISKPPVTAAQFGSPQRPLLNFHTHAPPARQEPIRVRQVIPGTLRHYEGRPTTPPPAPPPPPAEPVTLLPPIATLPPSSPTPPPQRARTPPSGIILPSVPSLSEPVDPAPRRTARARAPKPVAQLPQGPQLKALTNANTLKNQAWTTTTLETLIVRRPGARPASPSTRMRTAAEKKREEAGREREARAKRRAGEDVPGESKRRHLRGPGEESDYETPESARVMDPGRAVRWDPGLVSTPERRGEDESFHMPKSCLTPAPNRARIPLHEVRREKVVITKFVYDDDDEALLDAVGSSSSSEPEPPAAPAKPKARKRKAAETPA